MKPTPKQGEIQERRTKLLRLLYLSVPTPSFRDAAKALKVSTGTVVADARALAKDGLLDYFEGKARSLYVTQAGAERVRR